jgi:rhodanese-related sulfurtransferase
MMNTREIVEAAFRGEVLIVDVRGQDSYDAYHFPLAIRAKTRAELKKLPRDKPIWLYCT